MKIFLVRHGVKEKTPGDPQLSKLGREQAENTGLHLKSFKIDKVIASPMNRTQETASIICKHLNLEFTIDAKLRERMNWGDFPGQSFEDFLTEWEVADNDRHFQPKSGDSSVKAGNRLEEVIIGNNDKYPNQNIVLVCHGGIIADFLRNIFSNEELDAAYESFSMVKAGAIKECSITILNYEGGKYGIENLALIDHIHAGE